MSKTDKKSSLMPCYYASFFIGMIALEVGVILPYLMNEMQLSYSLAGGLLSAFALGNLIASLLNPILSRKCSSEFVTILLSSLLTVSLFVLTLMPRYQVLYGIILMLGLGRGTINIYIFATANKNAFGKTIDVHLLSVTFALGALMAPLLTSLLLYFGLTWKEIVSLFGIISIGVPAFVGFYHFQGMKGEALKPFTKQKTRFYKCKEFYILGGILFCYIGLENCVNGWFIQYFKDINLIPSEYANLLVSMTWLLILVGRLFTTAISTKISSSLLIFINCMGTAGFFLLMIGTKNPMIITLSIGGLGFFCAGIYPASIAESKRYISNSTSGMSVLLAFSSFGGIIIPQIIGVIADYMGLVSAILYLMIIMIGMVSLAIINILKMKKE